MKKLNEIKRVPTGHQVIWWVCRALLLTFAVYGIFNNSVTMFLMGLFSIGFTHLWDFFQLFGGRSFITRVDHFSQTLLAIFLVWSCFVYLMNVHTNVHWLDNISHTLAGFVAVWFGFDLVTVMQGKKYHIKPAVAAMWAFFFALMLVLAWEMYEFIMDRVYGYELQTSDIISERGLVDTMTDLIEGVAGAFIGMFLTAFYRTGIIGPDRRARRAAFKEQSRRDRAEELALLGIEDIRKPKKDKKAAKAAKKKT